MKLNFPASCLGIPAFADFWVFGEPAPGPLALVAYVGGAIPEPEYERRRITEPTELFDVFAMLHDHSQETFGALVVPSPPIRTPDRTILRTLFLDHFSQELLPGLGTEVRAASFVGFSFGAFFAAILAASHPSVARGLVIMAGVGMTEGWQLSGCPAGGGFALSRCFVNDDDPCAHYAVEFASVLKGAGCAVEASHAPGGHAFADYLANGSVEQALAFAIGRTASSLRSGT